MPSLEPVVCDWRKSHSQTGYQTGSIGMRTWVWSVGRFLCGVCLPVRGVQRIRGLVLGSRFQTLDKVEEMLQRERMITPEIIYIYIYI